MSKKLYFLIAALFCSACHSDNEKTKPVIAPITESVYAAGIIKSKDQYQVFPKVNGIIRRVFVTEGDSVKIGTPLLSISNDPERITKENAELEANFFDFSTNQGQINEAQKLKDAAKSKMRNDSALYSRQQALWKQQIGTKVQLEQTALNYENSQTAYFSSVVKYNDLKRQLKLNSQQSKKKLAIATRQESDFILKSEVNGTVYRVYKTKGELAGSQTLLALIGSTNKFLLEMQIDEYEIIKVKINQEVLITMDSYKGKVFIGRVTKLYPIMDEKSKTFLVEAEFIKQPDTLYPNTTFEANIVIRTKKNALLIPRDYLLNDAFVIKGKNDTARVITGLKDYQKVEILSGVKATDVLRKPKQ
ncbi:efflux RND transporter periplasmic adaptor subunit [Mucilaginibacter xinganensis]|uniref:RND family efflux transporter, MFP subunit n=1 Tax=Mucilaginibacter xinganensis TaxID=1234841 RepID=A0A223NW59_9SPHI|nr:efflux RND transporter periplasmic adaptor subunit [Mucilaginibacter xinganensis]ASU34066.1 RND family efflux transporter, MFP subunit [Mucilaginibacter xinganensis]